MPVDFEISGGAEIARLSKALKDAGRTGLRKELNKGLRDAAKPLIVKSRAEAQRRLPRRGGLAAKIAKAPQRVAVRLDGVSIVAGKRRSASGTTNNGTVRHPVFGNRKVWVVQRVTPGWFEAPMRDGAAEVRPELQAAMERIAEKVVRETR